MLTKLRAHLSGLLTALNYFGSILLAYALQNPGAMTELRGLLPPAVQPYAWTLAIGWFALVQYAKMKAVAKAG